MGIRKGSCPAFIRNVALPYTGTDCLTWPFSRNRGYGQLLIGGKPVGAHRVVCEMAHGAPPSPRHEAAHSCGNGHLGCVNPNHLSWKTRAENDADRLLHGTTNRGERQGISKLTEAHVMKIANSTARGVDLARQYSISPARISDIRSGRGWAWLTGKGLPS